MNYLDPDRLDAIAQRYVAGTMSARARRRFDQLMESEPAAASAVYRIEARLSPMAWSLPPVEPSPFVWRRIRAEIARRPRATSSTPRAGYGPGALAAALLLGLIVASAGWWLAPERGRVDAPLAAPLVAVIPDEADRPLWSALLYTAEGRATFSAVGEPAPADDNDYQLWLLDRDGQPVSLGLLPKSGERTVTLALDALTRLDGATTVAVSLEPIGGSPRPTPSGPVLYTAALLAP